MIARAPQGGVSPGLLVRTSFRALKRLGWYSVEAARADTADEVRLAWPSGSAAATKPSPERISPPPSGIASGFGWAANRSPASTWPSALASRSVVLAARSA